MLTIDYRCFLFIEIVALVHILFQQKVTHETEQGVSRILYIQPFKTLVGVIYQIFNVFWSSLCPHTHIILLFTFILYNLKWENPNENELIFRSHLILYMGV